MTPSDGALPITVASERVVLLPERALYWPRRATLLLADPHFGKAATFRAHGMPVPAGTTDEGLTRLNGALRRTGAERIVFLGDFLHARAGRTAGTLDAIARWRADLAGVDVLLVRGNHDRRAGDPPETIGIRCADPPLLDRPFALVHEPVDVGSSYTLAGHVHPGIRLRGVGGLQARLPCFVFGPRGAVLPAFGDFTGLAIVAPASGERIFAVAGESVVEVRGDAG